MSWLANLAYFLAAIVYLPVLLYQMLVQKKNRTGWVERLSGPRRNLCGLDRPIWVHAVSLGEINAARNLVAQLEAGQDRPIVISSTTDTGYARAVKLFGESRVFRFPLDFSWSVGAALRGLNPSMIVLMELEVWFNLSTMAAGRGIPVAVVNGRLTERSRRRLGWLGPLARRMFRSIRWVGAQDETIGRRFVSLGLPQDRLTVTGSVKWDTAEIADSVEGATDLAEQMGMDAAQPLWVCGSTGPGEEGLLLDAYRELRTRWPELQLALIPRKPERFDEVAGLIEKKGFECRRRSTLDQDKSQTRSSRPVVFMGDTMGELRKFYALATVVFVGRTLVPMGGSDPMEVAGLARCIIVGPHFDNFNLPVQILEKGDAIRIVQDAEQLSDFISQLLADPDTIRSIGDRAQRIVLDNRGATDATVRQLLSILDAWDDDQETSQTTGANLTAAP